MSEPDLPDPLSSEAATRLCNWVIDTYVLPEIHRRQTDGDLPIPFRITMAQVIFDIDEPAQIRLNDEVKGSAMVKAARPIQAGEEMMVDDIKGWSRFELGDNDPNAAHVTILPLPGGHWGLSFDWQYNAALIGQHVDHARQFFEQAEAADQAGRLMAFPDAAFAAAELLARAELLALPDRAFRDAKSHDTVRARYNEWAHAGNTEQRFAKLLNKLDALRNPTRYLRGTVDLSAEAASEMLATLSDMLAHVEEVAPDRDFDRPPRPPRALTFRAAEDIKAGEPVTLLPRRLGRFDA